MYNNIMARQIIKDNPKAEDFNSEEPILKTIDRCDQCYAQAYVMIKGSTGELLFCGHHYDKIMNNPDAYTKMMAFMLEIVDERHRLIENKLVGSPN